MFGIDHGTRIHAAHVDRGGGAVGTDLDAGQAGDRGEGHVGDGTDGEADAVATAQHAAVGALGDDGVGAQRQLADAVAAARVHGDLAAEAAVAADQDALGIGWRLPGNGAGGGLGLGRGQGEGGTQCQGEQGGPADGTMVVHAKGDSGGGGGGPPRRLESARPG
ncbi:hypothetical protein QE400_001805 [Xanthomonas sacchari]|nr:hypothetical protein [Xanthomonas sacchari]